MTEVPAADADEQIRSSRFSPIEHGTWVVGIDGSDHALAALDWATTNAPGRASSLRLVTAWQIPVVGATAIGSGPVMVPFDTEQFRAAAQQPLDELAADLHATVTTPIETMAAEGAPASVLLDVSTDASLLVIGTRGRGGFARLLLGSTSTQCATHAVAPTVVVPESSGTIAAQRIAVGVDGSRNSLAALRWALHFAAPGSTVAATWVWNSTPIAVGVDSYAFPEADELSQARFERLIADAGPLADDNDVTLEGTFVSGAPRAVLKEAGLEADLLVVGARGHGAVSAAILGSVSTWLLHHAGMPVAVIPFESADDSAILDA